MVRAVADRGRVPSAMLGNQKFTVWSSRVHPHASKAQPGSVISVARPPIACGDGALGNRHRKAGDGMTYGRAGIKRRRGLVQIYVE
ncbi:hypothetical protein ACLK1S_14035 [Escherichia coli]